VKLTAVNLDFYFGTQKILDKISFKGKESNFIGIIGPNGSGKTTLLKTFSRLLEPQGGIIYLNGAKISNLSYREVAKNLSTVPQDTAVNFDFTAFEVVKMGRTPHIGRFQRERPLDIKIAEKTMRQTKTHMLKERPINTLSGGERQKVIIAKALAQQPAVLLLDEPTANLDIRNQVEIMDLIREAVLEKGIAAIMAIHDINLAARYCDEIALLKEGRIFAKGPPKLALTPDNIKEVFGILCVVNGDPANGGVYVVPRSGNAKR
jgi:iron complex transport system ATP-binding protein